MALEFSFCRGIQSQILTHAMKIVTILWPLLGLDQLWYLVSSARASLIHQTRLEVTFGLLQKQSPCCRMDGDLLLQSSPTPVSEAQGTHVRWLLLWGHLAQGVHRHVLSSLDSNISNVIWHHVGLKYAMSFSGGIWRTRCFCFYFRFP